MTKMIDYASILDSMCNTRTYENIYTRKSNHDEHIWIKTFEPFPPDIILYSEGELTHVLISSTDEILFVRYDEGSEPDFFSKYDIMIEWDVTEEQFFQLSLIHDMGFLDYEILKSAMKFAMGYHKHVTD